MAPLFALFVAYAVVLVGDLVLDVLAAVFRCCKGLHHKVGAGSAAGDGRDAGRLGDECWLTLVWV